MSPLTAEGRAAVEARLPRVRPRLELAAEDGTVLFVVEPDCWLEPGDELTLSWHYAGVTPDATTAARPRSRWSFLRRARRRA